MDASRMATALSPNPNLFMTIPEAGRFYFGLSRGGSYAAYHRGVFVTVRVGRNILVSIPGMNERIHRGYNVKPENGCGTPVDDGSTLVDDAHTTATRDEAA
jgi:hypothetical protein